MRRRVVSATVLPLCLGIALLAGHASAARTANPLRSFYVVRFFWEAMSACV